MPRVRRYESQQVSRQPLPSVRLSTDAPAAAFGPPKPIDTEPVLRLATQEYERERDKADQIAITDASGKLSQLEGDLLYGQKGILNREGKDVFGAEDELHANWEKSVGEIGKTLKSDRQKMAFQKAAAETWQSVNRQTQRHVATESKRYDADVTEALIKNEQDNAVLGYRDPERVTQAIAKQVDAIKGYAARHGVPQEALEASVSKTISSTHVRVIGRMLANDEDLIADNYFKAHKDQISGQDIAKVEQDLEEGSLRGKSQRESDKILATAKSRTESDELVKAITDPKLRDEVDRRVDQGWRDRREREREGEDTNFKAAVNLIESKRASNAVAVRAAIPPAMWRTLTLSQRSALINYGENEIGGGTGGSGNRATADSKYLDFLDLEPRELANMTRSELETKYLQYLGKGDRRTAVSRWDKARKGDADGSAEVKSQFTLKDQITQSLAINADEVSKTDKTFIASVEREVALKREKAVRAKGKDLTDSEEQAIVDDVVIRQTFSRGTSIRGETRRTLYGQVKVVNTDGVARVPLSQVPDRRQNEIRARIQGRVTNDKIERAYAAFVIGDMARFNAIMGEQ